MCANDAGGSGRVQLHCRVSTEAKQQIEEYAELHDCAQWEAVDSLIKIAAGSTDVGRQIESMDAKLQRVLEQLDAPGIGQQLADGQVAADGAVTQKIDYDNLPWEHDLEISSEEADFSDPSVVSQTPRSRVPVIRGILLGNDRERITPGELTALTRGVFDCTLPTARGYVETGSGKSWYPDPGWYLTESEDLWIAFKEEMQEAGVAERVLEQKEGFQSYCSEKVEISREGRPTEERYVLPVEEEYLVERELFNAKIRQILSNMEQQLREHPKSGKFKLLLEWYLAYGQREGDLQESDVEAVRERLEKAGVQLPNREWW